MHAGALLDFLARRTIPGVEWVDGTSYHRGLLLPHGPAQVSLTPQADHVAAGLRLSDVRDLAPAVARCRRLLDLDADPEAVDNVLAEDPALAAVVADEPGVRVPRAVDGFEMAVRAIVGQQISVAGARTVLAHLVSAHAPDATGPRPAAESDPAPRLRPFPTPAELLDLPDVAFRMPIARRETVRTLARTMAEGDLLLDPGADRVETVRLLIDLPGIGPWTAAYVAMRALGDPDVLLPTDLGVRRGAGTLGLSTVPAELRRYAERWRPWRSYAVVRLWRALQPVT